MKYNAWITTITKLGCDKMRFHYVQAKGLLSAQNGMNIYRGCTHGCIYCDARSKCYQMQHDFEDVEVKQNAPQLLEAALRKKRSRCIISTGAMSDPYIHLEEDLKLMRQCLEIINKYSFGCNIQTKSNRILRDIDLLQSINQKSKCVVQITLTTFDEKMCKILEPDVSTTFERAKALKQLNKAGIPTIVWLSPLMPFLNDTAENIKGIIELCAEANVAGIIFFGAGTTLRSGNREYFYKQIDKNFPGMSKKYHQNFGSSYGISSKNSKELSKLFHAQCQKYNILHTNKEVFKFAYNFAENANKQLSFFD